jgi:hypothetical protein
MVTIVAINVTTNVIDENTKDSVSNVVKISPPFYGDDTLALLYIAVLYILS